MDMPQNDYRNRQDRLNKLIGSVVEHIELEGADLSRYCEELGDIYSEPSFRHSYSQISVAVESLVADQRDVLCTNLLMIEERAKESFAANEAYQASDVLLKIAKLCDHVELECIRLSRIDRVEFVGKEASKALNAAGGKLQETEDKAKELGERVTDYHAQSISILGIFAGLVITFSAVTNFSAEALKGFGDAGAYKITFFLSLSFFFLFNVVFMLMYTISKIAGKSIASDCRRTSCANCKKCRLIGRFVRKYPYVFWFEVVSLLLIGVNCLIAINK